MTRVNRFDFAAASSLRPAQRLDNGWLRVDGWISRVGVQAYQDGAGGVRRELRLPEEVFEPTSLASFAQVPVTNTHPPGLLDAQTAKAHTVGAAGDCRRDGDYVAAAMNIFDADAIAAAEAGRSQLSCGYSCRLDATPGTHPQFGPYDVVQREIRGNHVALVDTARAGPGARIRLDAGDAQSIPDPQENPMPQEVRIDGLALQVSEANAPAIQQAIDRQRTTLDAATAAKVAADKVLEALQAKHDAEKRRADEADKPMMKCDKCEGGKVDGVKCEVCDGLGEVPKAAKADAVRAWLDGAIARGVKARVALEVEARKHLGAETKLDGLDEVAVKRAVVEKLAGVKLDGKGAAYVEAAYEHELARAAKAPGSIDKVRGVLPVSPTRADGVAPRERMIQDMNARSRGDQAAAK